MHLLMQRLELVLRESIVLLMTKNYNYVVQSNC